MIEINKIRLCNLTHSRLGSTFKWQPCRPVAFCKK